MKCLNCGADNPDNEWLCGACGKELTQPQQVSKGVRALSYILSILIPFAGFIVGAVLYSKRSPEYRRVAAYCVSFGIVVTLVFFAAALYFMSLGFGGCPCSPGILVLKKSDIPNGTKIEFTAPTAEVRWDDLAIQLWNGTDTYSWSRITGLTSDHLPAVWHDSKARSVGTMSVWLNVTDLAGNGRMSNGDFLTFQVASPSEFPTGKVCTLVLIYKPTQGSMLSYDIAL